MIVQITFLVCIFSLSLSANAEPDTDTPGKKKFDETHVREDVDTANGILKIIRENFDMMETTDGILSLCDKMRMKFTAMEGNELFKASVIRSPTRQPLLGRFPQGLYYACPTHVEDDVTNIQAPINTIYFDGTHIFWNSYGASDKVCDMVPGAPFVYTYGNSLIEKKPWPLVSPAIVMALPYLAKDEARSLGLVPGLGDEWNDIYVTVGGEGLDVYQHQLILLPVKKSLCPDMVDPEKDTFDVL